MQKADLTIETEVQKKARLLGIDGEGHEYGILGTLLDLCGTAAPITHPSGNRINGEWLFTIHHGVVVHIRRIMCETCLDRRRIQVWNECPSCQGLGCKQCRGKGDIPSQIPCQSCTYQTKTQGGNHEKTDQKAKAQVETVAPGDY